MTIKRESVIAALHTAVPDCDVLRADNGPLSEAEGAQAQKSARRLIQHWSHE